MKKPIFSITDKDFEIDWFSGTGAGGQHRNKHQNCCRLKHKETGIIKTGQSSRTREANKKEAFNNIINDKEFKMWLKIKTSEAFGHFSNIEKDVENQMKKIKVEVQDENGKWITEGGQK